MAALEAMPALTSTTGVFEPGGLNPLPFKVEKSDPASPPKELFVVIPTVAATYPVLLFFHGTCLCNTFYSQLLLHISSHGFIVVAPQMYNGMPPLCLQESEGAAAVTNWLPTGLQSVLNQQGVNVQADLTRLAAAGHSRGGKTAFALVLGYCEPKLKFSVLVAVDPVAGVTSFCRTKPKILTYVPRSFDLGVPVAVIGTGLGPVPRMIVACAPDGLNHEEFFRECKPPCAHFVAVDYGHMDMLDDDPPGCRGALSDCMCTNGKGARELMRRCVGGLVVAFLNAHLGGESTDLKTIVDDPSVSPARLGEVEYIEA